MAPALQLFRLSIVAGLFAGALAHGTLAAQEFPTRPVRIVVGQGAGGGMDTIARLIGQRLTPGLGQPVVVENRTGAGNDRHGDRGAGTCRRLHAAARAHRQHGVHAHPEFAHAGVNHC